MHFSPKGIVAVSQYRKVGVNSTPTGGPIRARLLGGLIRVMGNYHARFLEDLGLATAPGYPVLLESTLNLLTMHPICATLSKTNGGKPWAKHQQFEPGLSLT